MNPFDFFTSVSYSKVDLMTGTANDNLVAKEYNPFIINKAASYFPDSIMTANIMNKFPHLPKRLQYRFYLNTLRPRKRYAKWAKKDNDDDIAILQKYYNYSFVKAQAASLLLSEQELKIIRDRIIIGVES